MKVFIQELVLGMGRRRARGDYKAIVVHVEGGAHVAGSTFTEGLRECATERDGERKRSRSRGRSGSRSRRRKVYSKLTQ